MSFRPSIHGWPFSNVPGVPAHVLGLGAPPAVGVALGGGLCWAALDRYLRGIRIPRSTERPQEGEPLHAELIQRQVALSGTWRRVREWQAAPDSSWRDRLPVRISGGRDVASRTRAEWPTIRTRLNDGEPVLLTVLLPSDLYRSGRSARQVLATAWRLEDVRIVLSLYDPERPDDDGVELSFRPAGPLGARLSDGSAVRGFMAIPYDRVVPSAVGAETFGDRSVLGLNRKVRGGVSAVMARRRIDLVGRSADGALLHFYRAAGASWEGANITQQEEFGSHELHSDPVAVRSVGLHIFSRNYVGDLLHFRLGRSWSVANRTDHKRAGARFRLVSDPTVAAGPWGRISVLGVDKDGGLVHYAGRPVIGWRAEQVAGDPLKGRPVAGWLGSTLHVAGTARDGRVLHWCWDGERWTMTDLSTLSGGGAPRLEGDVAMQIRDETVYLAGRSTDGRMILVRQANAGGWDVTAIEGPLAGEPVLASGPAGTHVFAPTEGGDVLHAWEGMDGGAPGVWLHEEVLGGRSSLGTLPATRTLTCWGSSHELRVWGRADRDLWTLGWRADSDWVLERLSHRTGVAERHRPGDDPVVVQDARGLPHLFLTDGRGTIVHVQPTEWREPDGSTAPVEAAAPTRAPSTRAPAATAEPVIAAAAPKPGPAPDLPYLDFEDARPITSGASTADLPVIGAKQEEQEEQEEPEPEQEQAEEEKQTETQEIEPMDLSLMDSWPPEPRSMQKNEPTDEAKRKTS